LSRPNAIVRFAAVRLASRIPLLAMKLSRADS
jgi:hypothetical protein